MKRKWIGGGLVIAVLFVGFAFVREYMRNRDYSAEVARMEAENASLEQGQLATTELMRQLSTETKVEGDSRTKLNLAKEGESVFVVTDAEGAMTSGTSTQGTATLALAEDPSLSNPVKWLYYFFAPNKHGTL